MKKIYIKYNPYTVETEIRIEGKPVDKKSSLYSIRNERLQKWIEPSKNWKGFYEELYKELNSPEKLEITFQGTELDFEDLQYGTEKYGKKPFDNIELKSNCKDNQDDRLEKIKEEFEKLKYGPIEELKTEQIIKAFETTLSSEFEVVVVAPQSSGKSTLINAILGRTLLPVSTMAKTATLSRIKDVDGSEQFLVSCKDINGKVLADQEIASLKLLEELNSRAEDIEYIDITGDIPNIPSKHMNLVFVDTPGGNNQDYKEIMEKAIQSEDKGMLLYVFDPTQIGTIDSDAILKKIADTIQNSDKGKQSNDRFIFVCNKMDGQDLQERSYEDVIDNVKKQLSKQGIENPNLFLVSAQVCKAVRMKKAGLELREVEEDDYPSQVRKMNRCNRKLFEYSSISEKAKRKFNNQIDELRKNNDTKEFIPEIAEINSGIPALELAIKEYIEKYAMSIKIKNLHNVFMARAKEIDASNKYAAQLVKSEEEFNSVKAEAEKKERELQKSQTLKKFTDKVDEIQFDRDKIDEVLINLKSGLLERRNAYGDATVKEVMAKKVLAKERQELKKLATLVEDNLREELEEKMNKQCKEIMKEYQEYIQELDEEGFFNINGFSFRSVGGFSEFGDGVSWESIGSQYISSESEGTRKVKKKGFFNMLSRWFGKESGWAEVPNIVKKYKIKDVLRDKMTEFESNMEDYIEEQVVLTENQINGLKEYVKQNFQDIDKRVWEEMQKVKELVSSRDELEKQLKKNTEIANWLDLYLKEMDSILDV